MTAAKGRAGPEAGFSLVEMLVTLAIFAAVGIACYAILTTIIRVRDQTEGRLEAYATLDRALILFSRDLEQGSAQDVVFADDVLAFERPGPDGPRTVRYLVTDDTLIRQTTDPAGQGRLDQTLLTRVGGFDLRFLDGAGAWADVWPPESGEGDLRAVELALELQDFGADPVTILRLAELPRSLPPSLTQ